MLSIPIISQFEGKGIKAAIKGFQQLETRAQKASFILKKAGQAAALGFAAVGVAALTAGKFMWDFAQMARQDQLAQVQLAGTLKATTKATDAQIKGVEQWIDVTQRATGVADDDLRPGLNRLLRATKDVTKAQKLLSLALDISGRTGKPLETVVNALGKAYEGSNTALGKLGLGYTKAELKAKGFSTVQDELTKKFAGGANEKAATFEGTMDRLAITFGELKESLGYYILPFLQDLAEKAIKVSDAFGAKGFAGAIDELKFQLQFLLYNADGTLNSIGEQLNKIVGIFNMLKGGKNVYDFLTFKPVADIVATGGTDFAFNKGFGSGFADKIDRRAMEQARYRQTTAFGGFGASAPRTVITVQVSPVSDPTAVAKEIKRILNQVDRKDGGR